MATLCTLNPAALGAMTDPLTTVTMDRFSSLLALRRRRRDVATSSHHHQHHHHHRETASPHQMISSAPSSSSLSSSSSSASASSSSSAEAAAAAASSWPSSSPSPSSSSPPCLNLKRSIKNGEVIEHHGSIVVHGNVHSGAVMRAGGNIIVLGFIEGEVHAGTNGDEDAIIFALNLRSKALIIDGRDAEISHSGEVASFLGGKFRVQTIMDDEQSSLSQNRFASKTKSVRKASKVALFTGAYIFLVGLALLAFPEYLFGLFFDLKRSINEWVRVGAVLAIVFGVYYIGTAWGDMKGVDGAQSFYMSTVVGRIFLFLSFTWLVATGSAPFPVFIMGAVNFLGAMSMLYALRSPTSS